MKKLINIPIFDRPREKLVQKGVTALSSHELLMVILGEPSVRELIAFPMSSSGTTSVMEAPSPATKEQLSELGIKVQENTKKKAES